MVCFNPCFIGNCSHTAKYPLPPSPVSWFQSLFYWKLLSYRPFSFKPMRNWLNVSILVLLETALIQTFVLIHLTSNGCFNPCFIGNCSHTLTILLIDYIDLSFNPCFIGNCSHTRKWGRLFWKGGSFNPCFIGNCSHTIIGRAERPCEFKFQSLFYWKLLSYP